MPKAKWVKTEMLVKLSTARWPPMADLRHTSLKGVREDLTHRKRRELLVTQF
jgi:hypothetical protein